MARRNLKRNTGPTSASGGALAVAESKATRQAQRPTVDTVRLMAGMGRQSIGRDHNVYGSYLNVVPRRGWDDQTRMWFAHVQQAGYSAMHRWSEQVPLRLLQVLTELHPMAGMATRNNTALGLSPDDIKIVAEVPAGGGDIDDKGQAALEELWSRLPAHFSGMIGLGRALMRQTLWSGMHCAEGILSDSPLGGLKTIETFDPLSIRWRDLSDGRRVLEQEQISAQLSSVLPNAVYMGPLSEDGWRELPQETCIASPFDGDTDNPYGVPVYSAFLTEGLADIRDWKNIGDVMHAIVYPRLFFAFPFQELVQFAKDSIGTDSDVCTGAGPADESGNPTDITPTEYAFSAQEMFKTDIQGLGADQQLFGMKGGDVKTLTLADGMRGLKDPLEMRRLRLAQALDHPATMLNITQGGTQAYSGIEWKGYAKKLESMRGHVIATIVKLANLHLRYCGINAIAKAEVAKIETSDKKADEEARKIKIENETALIDMGFSTGDDSAVALTGTKVADPVRYAAWLERLGTPTAQPQPGAGAQA